MKPQNGRSLPKVAPTLQSVDPIYINPSVRIDVLKLWSYRMLRDAFSKATDHMVKADIAAELAKRGGVR